MTQIIKEVVRPRPVSCTKQPDGTWLWEQDEVPVNATICIRSYNYGSYLSYILLLVQEAKKDFPFITDGEIKIVHFGGDRFNRTFGIEFNVPNETIIPQEYTDIEYLHPTK